MTAIRGTPALLHLAGAQLLWNRFAPEAPGVAVALSGTQPKAPDPRLRTSVSQVYGHPPACACPYMHLAVMHSGRASQASTTLTPLASSFEKPECFASGSIIDADLGWLSFSSQLRTVNYVVSCPAVRGVPSLAVADADPPPCAWAAFRCAAIINACKAGAQSGVLDILCRLKMGMSFKHSNDKCLRLLECAGARFYSSPFPRLDGIIGYANNQLFMIA